MFYHKVYMNQIHSSSLLCQLASMWKNQVLCDAVIKAGNSHIKAHRVVLVAACPMLHSMKNASVGSNLEVRLAADIKVEAINTFLQYLYEGFMMLTEENARDVEKIARVLQVDSVLKCCADFYKCLHAGDRYEYSFHDNAEFKHVRASELLKVHERNKRISDIQPPSPGAKRQRIQSRGSSDSYINDFGSSDPWDRVPREGLSGSSSMRTNQPGVIEIMEDSVEIVHSDKPEDSGGTRRDNPQDRMSLSVASQMKANTDVQIVNVSSGSEPSSRATTSSSDSSRFSSHPSLSHSQGSSSIGYRHDPGFTNPNSTSGARLPTSPSTHSRMPSPSSAYHLPQRSSAHSQPKPFAAGNAAQASKSYNLPSPGEQSRSSTQDQSRVTAGASTVSFSSSLGGPPSSSPTTSTQAPPQPVALWRSTSSDAVASGSSTAQLTEKPLLQRSESTPATSDADISIVKVESEVSFDEQFHGDDPGVTFEPDDQAGDWNREDTSNEESNASEDKMPQWMTDSMKDVTPGNSAEGQGLPHYQPPYRSNLGRSPSLDPVNYVFIEVGQPLPEGYVRLDEEEKVCVPVIWLNRTLSQCVGKPAFFTLKKLVNGFVNPWECKYGGTSAYRNTPLEPVFNALLLYGMRKLNMTAQMTTRALNEKLATGRKKAQKMVRGFEIKSCPHNMLIIRVCPWKVGSRTGREQKGSGLAKDSNDASLHSIIPTEGRKQKRCVLCQLRKVRTRSGWEVLTQNRCSHCLVPLCTGVRNCFTLYHSFERSASTTEDRPSPSGESSGGRSKLSEYIDKLHELQTKAMYFDMVRNRPKISPVTDTSDEAESSEASSEVLKGLDLTIRSSQQKHVPIYNKDRKYTPCLYCGRLKNRTRSGWRVNTFYRCLQCDVPLCVNDRNCFVLYHKYFLGMTNVESPGRRRSRDTSHVEVKKESNG